VFAHKPPILRPEIVVRKPKRWLAPMAQWQLGGNITVSWNGRKERHRALAIDRCFVKKADQAVLDLLAQNSSTNAWTHRGWFHGRHFDVSRGLTSGRFGKSPDKSRSSSGATVKQSLTVVWRDEFCVKLSFHSTGKDALIWSEVRFDIEQEI
jgi:hypothetical protein